MKKITALTLSVLGTLAIGSVVAAPVTYKIDPTHTYPSFEADHQGLSIYRGKFNNSSGTIVLDKVAKTGTVEIIVDTASVDFGYDLMNEHARTRDTLFDVAKFPTATYKGKIVFTGDTPSEVQGELTLKGITKPVNLKLNSFACSVNERSKVESCGADAITTFNRVDFGVTGAVTKSPDVLLRIMVQGVAQP